MYTNTKKLFAHAQKHSHHHGHHGHEARRVDIFDAIIHCVTYPSVKIGQTYK